MFVHLQTSEKLYKILELLISKGLNQGFGELILRFADVLVVK